MQSRVAAPANATVAISTRVERSRSTYEPLPVDKLVVDGVDPIDDNLARVRAYLEEAR